MLGQYYSKEFPELSARISMITRVSNVRSSVNKSTMQHVLQGRGVEQRDTDQVKPCYFALSLWRGYSDPSLPNVDPVALKIWMVDSTGTLLFPISLTAGVAPSRGPLLEKIMYMFA